MKISGGLEEEGIVVGNSYDKYSSRNPVVRWLMNGFHNALDDLVNQASPQTIHEVGCGEGYWVSEWNRRGIQARGSDFSSQIIEIAKDNARSEGGQLVDAYHQRSIYDLTEREDSADLMVCCEVMEHLEEPEEALKSLQRVATKYVILSVPREPVWCVMNMMRGKYWLRLGNTPGHIQHWSKTGFLKVVSKYFDIVQIKSPLPWTMVLCRVKQ